MLAIAEELLLFLLDEENGALLPIPDVIMKVAFAGAVLMELQIDGCIDTSLDTLTVIDSTPLGDDLLDPTLAEIARAEATHDAVFWLEHVAAERGEQIRNRAIERLVERGIISEPDESGLLAISAALSRTRRYPVTGGKTHEDIRLRVMRVLFSDDIPDPHEIAIITLSQAVGLFQRMLSAQEEQLARERIDLLCRMDQIGRAVGQTVRVYQSSEEEAALPARPIPKVPGLPLLGSILEVRRGDPALFAKYYQRLGPVYQIQLLRKHYTVLAGPDANRFFARRERFYLSTGDLWEEFRRDLGASRFLLGMDGPEHHRLRREIKNGYSAQLFERSLPEAVRIVRRHIERWGLNEPQPAFRSLQRLVGNQLGVLATSAEDSQCDEYIDDVIVAFKTMVLSRVIKVQPRIATRTSRFLRARQRMLRLCRQVLAKHEMQGVRQTPDLIDELLRLHGADPTFLPEIDLVALTLLPFIAGVDTSGSTMAFMLWVLLTRPDLQERMRAEADELFAGGMPTARGLRKMDVTRRIAMETMRLYPVTPAARRRAASSFSFAGHRIRAGAELFMATSAPHFLPECFPEPEQFDIDRYLPGREEHRQPGAYAPFGLGAHGCLGSGLAREQIALTLATLLHDTEVELDPPNYRLKMVVAPFQAPDDGFRFRIVARRSNAG